MFCCCVRRRHPNPPPRRRRAVPLRRARGSLRRGRRAANSRGEPGRLLPAGGHKPVAGFFCGRFIRPNSVAEAHPAAATSAGPGEDRRGAPRAAACRRREQPGSGGGGVGGGDGGVRPRGGRRRASAAVPAGLSGAGRWLHAPGVSRGGAVPPPAPAARSPALAGSSG